MTSHIIVSTLDPHRPATFSRTVIGVLREEMGFGGLIVSDALDMAGASAETGIPEAAVRALVAGVDLLCLGSQTLPETYAAVHAAVLAAVRSGRLPEHRVVEAAGRVRALAAVTSERMPGHGIRSDLTAAPILADQNVVRAFRIGDAARSWLSAAGPVAVVQVDSSANLAVGGVAWGPAALGATVAEADVPAGARVAVVGRAIGMGHAASEAAGRLRALGHDVVLVECGWPRGGADIETFGGSPAVARPLLALLRGEVSP